MSDFLAKLTQMYHGAITYAVIDKTKPPSAEDDEGELAGMISYISTSTTHLSTEIGGVITLPAFHRTHVTSNAVGLLLEFALDSPMNGGLGLRRVQWQTSTVNTASLLLAERLGFKKEGVLRWCVVYRQGAHNGKIGNGRPLPPGSNEGDLGRHTVVLSVCWDHWADGGRGKVEQVMARTK